MVLTFISDYYITIMETKSAKERFWDSQLEYLNARPLLEEASSELDKEWMQLVINQTETMDPTMLSLKNKNDLPTKKSVLVLFHFFRNLDKSSSKFAIAEKVMAEIDKYWLRSNIPTQTVCWVKKGIMDLNNR